jgi:hypothetical protein
VCRRRAQGQRNGQRPDHSFRKLTG